MLYYDEVPPSNEAKRNETIFMEYFKKRGWIANKIEEGFDLTSDFLVENNDYKILCELKTILSARREMNTQSDFENNFCKKVYDYFQKKPYTKLPCRLYIHNHLMLIPSENMLKKFLYDITKDIIYLLKNNPKDQLNWSHTNNKWDFYGNNLYLCSYDFMEGKIEISFQITGIEMRFDQYLQIPIYGILNNRAISDSINKGIKQLDTYANNSQLNQIPKIIAISLNGDIKIEHLYYAKIINRVFGKNPQISAIATFDWICMDNSNSTFIEWISNNQFFLRFFVFHNPNCEKQNLPRLPLSVFDDGYSLQYETPEDFRQQYLWLQNLPD
ncbi:hypothetical protein [Herpetosiphon gulosus]|uniref:Uncharacterized protein n=1 Tax=Herpetosiphon gulosus TaxID=1973496 RepID=A0ABP9X4K0_9CHLR